MDFSSLLSRMLVLFIFLAVGVLCSKAGFLDEHTGGKLNKIVINIGAPCIVINSVLNSEYSYGLGDILTLLGYAAIFDVLMLLVAWAATAFFCRKHPDRGTYQYMMAFGNCVFMGIAVIASLYGDGAVFLVAICSIPFNILSFSVGILMIGGGLKHAGQFWKKLISAPFLANFVALALFLFPVKAPDFVRDVVSSLGGIVIPFTMILIGAALSRMPLREIFADWRLYALVVSKLILAPLVVYFICRMFIRDPVFLNIITVSAVMPSASVSPIMAAEYGGNPELASRGVFVTTLVSLATIPLMLSFLLI